MIIDRPITMMWHNFHICPSIPIRGLYWWAVQYSGCFYKLTVPSVPLTHGTSHTWFLFTFWEEVAIELADWPISCQSPVNQILVSSHIWGTSSAAERLSCERKIHGSMPRVGKLTLIKNILICIISKKWSTTCRWEKLGKAAAGLSQGHSMKKMKCLNFFYIYIWNFGECYTLLPVLLLYLQLALQ